MKQRYFILVITALLGLASTAFSSVLSKSAVMLEILDGETAFVVDPGQGKAWWVVEECRRPIPINKSTGISQNNSYKTMTSETISNNVRIGSRQVTLKQQFRFKLATTPDGQYSAEVYNSLRGGWSPVPVRLNATCALDASCRFRMELPEC